MEAVNTAIAGKADSMEISGHTLVLKSGETAIATIDIPAVSEEEVQSAVNNYLQDNPIEIITDKTLTEENVPADAKATGDRITQLSGKVDNLNNVDFHFCKADEVGMDGLPNIAEPQEKVIYFVPNNGEKPNVFDEYVWHNEWEYFGSASVDMSEYVKFTDYMGVEKVGVAKLANRSIANGISIDSDNRLELQTLYESEILKKSRIPKVAVMLRDIELISVQSTHQEMSDTYDPSTALTPDGNVPYAYGGRQPVSYDAVKRYVDNDVNYWEQRTTPDIEITSEEEVTYFWIDEINGLPFLFDSVYVTIEIPACDKTRVIMSDTKGQRYSGFLTYTNTSNKTVINVFIRKILGIYCMDICSYLEKSWVDFRENLIRNMDGFQTSRSITGINIGTEVSSFPVGTVIKIYGKPTKKEVTP